MLGVFIIRILILLLGYIYPAFECYKTVEKNKADMEELRFWCQYWILMALVTSFEWAGDIFISWLPFYCEMKLIFVIFLWYPKTKGARYVYETMVRPYIAEHEKDIDRTIMEMKARAWDFFLHYSQSCAHVGQSTLVQAFEFARNQSGRLSYPLNQKTVEQNTEAPGQTPSVAEPSEPELMRVKEILSSLRTLEKQPSRGKQLPPPTPPPTPSPSTTDLLRPPAAEPDDGDDNSLPLPDSITDSGARLRRTKAQTAA